MGRARSTYWAEEICVQGIYGGTLGADGRIILKWVFEKWGGTWIGSIWLRIGTGG